MDRSGHEASLLPPGRLRPAGRWDPAPRHPSYGVSGWQRGTRAVTLGTAGAYARAHRARLRRPCRSPLPLFFLPRRARKRCGLRADDIAYRLVVLGGKGHSAAPFGEPPLSFGNNDGWCDDISDGPVTATLTLEGRAVPVEPAWVVVAPPNPPGPRAHHPPRHRPRRRLDRRRRRRRSLRPPVLAGHPHGPVHRHARRRSRPRPPGRRPGGDDPLHQRRRRRPRRLPAQPPHLLPL
ncbi:LodA/GoxA family CTQ-dependent oxidase [Streptomyces lavenduligriseus]|nr:LodA/GoxA family CTQ-dependent oxidase [Streptomyces lavenduligriseus]